MKTISELKQQCYACGLNNDAVRVYGDLRSKSTWECAYASIVTAEDDAVSVPQDDFTKVLEQAAKSVTATAEARYEAKEPAIAIKEKNKPYRRRSCIRKLLEQGAILSTFCWMVAAVMF